MSCRLTIRPMTLERGKMFEDQYNEEMEREVRRLEALKRATDLGHPEWLNACTVCGCRLLATDISKCEDCT